MKRLFIVILVSMFLMACESTPKRVITTESQEQVTAPGDYKDDEDVWGNTGRKVKIQGCEEWKKRNPKADC